jgi:hypothetical protein
VKTLFDYGSSRNQKDKESENVLFYKHATPMGFKNFENSFPNRSFGRRGKVLVMLYFSGAGYI